MKETCGSCPVLDSKDITARKIIEMTIQQIRENALSKINLIWLEATGCTGNLISLMNGESPDILYLLNEMVWLKYNNSLMSSEGERAYEIFLEAIETEFILVVEGAASIKDNGVYNIFAKTGDQIITSMEAIQMAGEKAKYVLAAGTCASYGGISAARPNPSGSVSISELLNRPVIRIPGCPAHPDWVIATIANLLSFGMPELDDQNRPMMFYGVTVHDRCTRRAFFDHGVFATKLGEPQCMFQIGCRGPVTKTDCPVRQWNGYVNWPVRDNTPCIGCAAGGFPDEMEPFIKY